MNSRREIAIVPQAGQLWLLILLLPGSAHGQDVHAILDEFAHGLQYVVVHESTVPIAAPPENPVRLEFAPGNKSNVQNIAVKRDGEHLFDMQDIWMWASVKGEIIDASLSLEEEAARRELANASGVAYKINEPRMLFTEGEVRFRGRAVIAGVEVECFAGAIRLTNARGHRREYDSDFSIDWTEGTVCRIDQQPYRRVADNWRTVSQKDLALKSTQQSRNDDPNRTADEWGLEKLRRYVAGETTFGTFQADFGKYFTQEAAIDPSSVPGYVLKPLYYTRSIKPPPELNAMARQSEYSSSVSEELQDYVSGIYVLGFLSGDVSGSISFTESPESFSVVAALAFENGRLVSIRFPDETRK